MTTEVDSSQAFRLRSDRDDPRLLRAVGAVAGVCALLAVTIGAGIYSVPQRAAEYIGSIPLILALWVAIGGVCLIGGLIWAELGTRMPYSGGDYLYMLKAYGPAVGFLFGWKSFLLSGPRNRAALSLVAADYVGAFVPLSANAHLAVAASVLGLACGVNYVGVAWASRFQSFSAVVKVAGLVLLVGVGFLLASPAEEFVAGVGMTPFTSATGVQFASVLLLIFFSYTGWARLGYMTGEMKDPRRDLPRAIVFGMVATVMLYFLINLLCFYALGLEGVRGSDVVVSDVAASFMGPRGYRLVAGLIVISVLGSLSVSILSHSRLYFSMAKDGLFFRFLDSVHPVFHTPHRAILIHGAMALLMLLLFRDFTALVTSTVFLNAIFYIVKAHTLFRLRKEGVGDERCYKIPMYPWLPLVFVVALYALCLGRLILDWQRAWVDVALLLVGVPAYFLWRRWKES